MQVTIRLEEGINRQILYYRYLSQKIGSNKAFRARGDGKRTNIKYDEYSRYVHNSHVMSNR